MMWKVVYGTLASFGAILQGAFVTAHPGHMLQHPLDMVGQDVACVMTMYCIWQFVHNGKAISNWRAGRSDD
jgi:hypothetical protein